jgi:ATP-binding cassette subfamily B multidrug efflux pump
MQERIDRVNAVLREQITGIRVVRAFVREPHEAARFGRSNADLTTTSLASGRLMAFMFPIVFTVLNASSVAAVWFGAARIDSGEMQIGSLIAFLSYLIQILMAVMMGTFVAVMTPRAQVCAERIEEVLRKPSTVADAEGAVGALPARPTLELRDVGFRYPGAEEAVVCGVTLTAAPGTTTAIIGSTGSGKTTLLNLVPRLFDATDGAVVLGGIDVRDVEQEVLWSHMGLVPQKPYLFSGTVGSNVRLGAPDATDAEVWDALRIAQADGFVRAMAEGLDSRVEQGGTNLSGGQRQRLAIARAVVRRPAIYLFDDSFSALDLATDARLRAALAPVLEDAAMVVVAQRVSTIVDADQILVLEDGRPVGLGPHAELVRTCPTYAEIVASQATQGVAA